MSRLFDIFPSQNMIFIMGLRRSGTSWVQSILNSHPSICTRVEDDCHEIIWDIRTALSKYNRTIKKLAWENDKEELVRTHSSEDFHDLVQFYFQMTARKTIEENEKTKADFIAFRDFSVTKYFGLLAELFEDAKFIYVVRDPRDAAISQWFHHKRVEQGFEEKVGNLQHHARNFAREWIRDYNRVFFHKAINKVKWHLIRYEDLHQNFENSCSELFSFVQINVPKDSRISKIKDSTNFETASGGRQPGDINDNAYLRSGTTQTWQDQLENRTLDIINAIAGRHMATLNYLDQEQIYQNNDKKNSDEELIQPPLAKENLKDLVKSKKNPTEKKY